MGDFITEKTKCGSCGRVCQQKTPEVYITFGPCDLDTRPAPLARYLISSRIQTCPHCGYTNYDISNEVEGYNEKIKENEYEDDTLVKGYD